MAPSRTIPLLKAGFAVAIWGASFIATKLALREVAPATVVWLRFGMGVLVLGAAVTWRREMTRVPLRELGYLALLGSLGIALHQALQSHALVTSQASVAAWIVTTTPIFIALLGWWLLGERLRWLQAAGILVAAAGVLLVVTGGDLAMLVRGRFGAPGDFLMVLSSPNWAVFSVLSRRGLRLHPPARMMFYVMGLGWLFTLPWAAAGPGFGDVLRLSSSGWVAIGFLGVFCSGLAYVFWYDALHALPASQVGALLYVEPLFAVVVAALLLGESASLTAAAGGATILLGVWLVNRRDRETSRP